MVSVLLYVANIIDYFRFVLLVVCLMVFETNPILFIASYIISAVLDAFDGMAARALNQSNTLISI
jgi:CDP-diacylglycerol--inositol 3-phosphatidyltransferase